MILKCINNENLLLEPLIIGKLYEGEINIYKNRYKIFDGSNYREYFLWRFEVLSKNELRKLKLSANEIC